MKVQILLTKKVPGAKRVEWPEVPEWVWEHCQRNDYDSVVVSLDKACRINIRGASDVHIASAHYTERIYYTYTREVMAENITDGPWLIQEPDRDVPLTVEELQAKFPKSDWSLLAVRPTQVVGMSWSTLRSSPSEWQSISNIVVLNHTTLETVKIAEVVE